MRSAAVVLCIAACGEVTDVQDASTPDVLTPPQLIIDPDLLDFGEVPSASEAVREVRVRSTGALALKAESIRLASGNQSKWSFEAERTLFDGLGPGDSAALTVRFRPCPEGWLEDAIDPSFDFSVCYERVAAGGIEIESNAGRATLSLAGKGAGLPPELMIIPQDSLRFSWDDAVEFTYGYLLISNRGGGELVIDDVAMDPRVSTSFLVDRGPGLPVAICSFDAPGCREPVYVIQVRFTQVLGVETETTVVIRSNDPERPELRLPVVATPSECAGPLAIIDDPVRFATTGDLITLSARLSMGTPSGGSLSSYGWSWIRTPTTAPTLSPVDRIEVSFVVPTAGMYVMGLEIENECGARSQVPTPAFIDVYDP